MRPSTRRRPGMALRGHLVFTSVRTWSPPDRGSHPITLISALHIGTAGYYEKIVELADANPDAVVLYEGTRSGALGEDEPVRMSGAETRAVRMERTAGGDVAHRQATSLLGLALHQSSLAPNYDRPHWHNADLHEIDIMRALGLNPAGTTAINGTSAWRNTLFVPQAQAAAVAAREDRPDLDPEQAAAETDRITQGVTTGAVPSEPGVAAACASYVARAVATDPAMRLRAMNSTRNEIRRAVGNLWSFRLLRGVVLAVTLPFTVKSRIRNRAIARHHAKVIGDWRDFTVMSMAMRRAQAGPVIVIYGAGHAPAHCEFLARNRFTETEVSWLEVMSVANPKGADRARVLAELTAMLADPAEAGTAADTPMVGQR